MSADFDAAPRLSLNVRYNRNDQGNSGEEEESQVEILEDEEHHTDLRPQRARPRNPAVGNRRCFRATAVILGAFYLLILAGLIIRLTLLQTRYDQLSNNYNQLQDEVKQLKDRTEVTLLQTRYDQLSNNYSQLQKKVSDKSCPDGWKRFVFSCYFKSKETKIWTGILDDCKKRGADLVVINNEDEQKFVTELSKDGESWIGLVYNPKLEKSKPEWTWGWIDGSPLTETFWAAGLPRKDVYMYMYGTTCCDQQGKWTQSHYNDLKNWICEK
ncbi:CD209 antigen-like protein C [Perca fluviatilis]|uniref:CD209 antigen-like protein C n=1 Tax=Perca fluviatilis TaxID=8168 RepID=UPI001962475B|nr:CD209 antigen-like protein C [Perca fluviatilis]